MVDRLINCLRIVILLTLQTHVALGQLKYTKCSVADNTFPLEGIQSLFRTTTTGSPSPRHGRKCCLSCDVIFSLLSETLFHRRAAQSVQVSIWEYTTFGNCVLWLRDGFLCNFQYFEIQRYFLNGSGGAADATFLQ